MGYRDFDQSRPPSSGGRAATDRAEPGVPSSQKDPQSAPPRAGPPKFDARKPTEILAYYRNNADQNRRADQFSNPNEKSNLKVYIEEIDESGNSIVTYSTYEAGDWDWDLEKALKNSINDFRIDPSKDNYTDWPFTSRDGDDGTLYICADNRKMCFSSWFVKNKPVTSVAPMLAPGFLDRGVGPFGWILYQIGGWQKIDAFKRWESQFEENARVYLTYSAPLSSDVFRIAEAITGESIEGGKKFTDEERVEKFISGVKGIIELAGSTEAEFLGQFLDQFIDYLIDRVEDEHIRKTLKDAKDAIGNLSEDLEFSETIEDLIKKAKKTNEKINSIKIEQSKF